MAAQLRQPCTKGRAFIRQSVRRGDARLEGGNRAKVGKPNAVRRPLPRQAFPAALAEDARLSCLACGTAAFDRCRHEERRKGKPPPRRTRNCLKEKTLLTEW